MTVFVVKSMDSNCVASLDKIFLHQEDAEQYICEQEKKYKYLEFSITEHPIL